MRIGTRGSLASFVFLSMCLVLAGCGTTTKPIACPLSGSGCGCGLPVNGAVCIGDSIPLLYATTTSNQILAFSINSPSGSLTALAPSTGPANSQSIAGVDSALMFADTSTNEVFGDTVNQVTGALTPVSGSPFSLGTPAGGPTSIMIGPYAYFYATEPNGTIIGYSTPSDGTLTAQLPGSPYPAGIAPTQMAFTAQANSGPSAFFLYVTDAGDPNGGILAYYLDPAGSLTPLSGSPFPTLPNAGPTSIYSAGYYQEGIQNLNDVFLFVSLTNVAKIAAFTVDPTSGALTPVPGSPFAAGNGPGTILEDVSNHLFILNAGDHTVSAFNIASNGALSPIASAVPAGTATGGMTLYPWTVLYVADTNASSIETFNVDPTTGVLSSAGAPFAVSSPPLQLTYVGP